jgi:hypothetical protein
MLSPRLLDILRVYWKRAQPRLWLFPGQEPGDHVSIGALQAACRVAKKRARINKPVTTHSLRHYVSFRTMSGIRNGLQISSEISDQVARGFCQLPNIVLPAYGRAIARSVECWGYRCLRNDFRNRPMSPARGPFAIETEQFVRRRCTVHGSLPRAGWIEEVKTMSPVTGEIRRGKPDRNREYPT